MRACARLIVLDIAGYFRYVFSFFSLVDLVSIVPFFIDVAVEGDLPVTRFVATPLLWRNLAPLAYACFC
jgi:hypothetical protein